MARKKMIELERITLAAGPDGVQLPGSLFEAPAKAADALIAAGVAKKSAGQLAAEREAARKAAAAKAAAAAKKAAAAKEKAENKEPAESEKADGAGQG